MRELKLLNGEGYSRDAAVLWAAYKAGSFTFPDNLTQAEFVKVVEDWLGRYGKVWIVDDGNSAFSSKNGQVCIVLTNSIDMIVDAEFDFFKWASRRNMLRAAAAFLNMIKSASKTGICFVRTTNGQRALCDHLKDYDLLYYIGRASIDEHLYSIRGRGT